MSKNFVSVHTETLSLISEEDQHLMQNIADDLKALSKKWGCFYTTIFLNEKNRKICFKLTYGKVTSAGIDKLDEERD